MISTKLTVMAVGATGSIGRLVVEEALHEGHAVRVFAPEELKELNASLSGIHAQSQRLPDGVLALSGVEAPPKA